MKVLTPDSSKVSPLEQFLEYSTLLTAACASRKEILGLVLVGSAADTARVDKWSDHDFFVITKDGEQEKLRQDLSWLPNFQSIAFSFRETEHGLKVLYQSGAVLEFAIFNCEQLQSCRVNHHALAFGSPEVAAALAQAVENSAPPATDMALSDFHHFLSLLVISVGRARRGEILTAGLGIRGGALNCLLKVFSQNLFPNVISDRFDPSRRFETAHPIIGARLASAVAQGPELAARELLEISQQFLPNLWSDYPFESVEVVQRVLGWKT